MMDIDVPIVISAKAGIESSKFALYAAIHRCL